MKLSDRGAGWLSPTTGWSLTVETGRQSTLETRRRLAAHAGGLGSTVLACVLFASCGASNPSGPSPSRLAITSVSPNSVSTTGGTPITLTGTAFAADATVTIGGRPATNVKVQGTSLITATTPTASGAGPADLVVSSGGQTVSWTGRFTFVAPSGSNQPPVVTSIRSVGTRPNQPSGFADIDETVTLIASVTDKETSVDALTFEWQGPGTFSGSGASVTWHIPASIGSTPAPVMVKVDIRETYTENGVTQTNIGSGEFVMQVHDSQKEIMDMGEDFLTLFSRSEVPTDLVLHNFSPTCDDGQGRTNEAADVDKNRATFIEDFSKFTVTRRPPVTFNFGGRCPFRSRTADACSAFTVHWEVTYRSGSNAGKREIADGVDYVTAVLQGNRWFLCHSDFDGTVQIPSLGIIKHVTW